MSELTLYLSSQQRKNQTGFLYQTPHLLDSRESWACALIDVTLDCNFNPKRNRLYLCGDFIEESNVNGLRASVLGKLEIRGKYKKTLYREILHPIYVPLRRDQAHQLRLFFVDDNLEEVSFEEGATIHCVLHFRRQWAR